jgi:hypothetical protein
MRTTTLNFFSDSSANYGVTHSNAIDINTPFDAFWSAGGIFHDIWEHYFEGYHPYFKNSIFNIGGEIAAIAHWYYYARMMGFTPRVWEGEVLIASIENIIDVTNSKMKKYISYGCSYYGDTLLCDVPYQNENRYIDPIILRHWQSIKDVEVITKNPQEIQRGNNYKKSISLSKLQCLYRWGYSQAEKLVPNNNHNLGALHEFYNAFRKITVKHNPEELSYDFKGIEVKIQGGNKIEWDANFIKHDETKIHYQHLIPKS